MRIVIQEAKGLDFKELQSQQPSWKDFHKLYERESNDKDATIKKLDSQIYELKLLAKRDS